jgi:hypothetical protein
LTTSFEIELDRVAHVSLLRPHHVIAKKNIMVNLRWLLRKVSCPSSERSGHNRQLALVGTSFNKRKEDRGRRTRSACIHDDVRSFLV